MLRGDFGLSVAYDTPVAELIAERLVVTAPLALLAMAMTTVLALGFESPPPLRAKSVDATDDLDPIAEADVPV